MLKKNRGKVAMYEALRLKFLGNFHRVFPPSHIQQHGRFRNLFAHCFSHRRRRLLHCRKKNAKINIIGG